MKDVAKEKNRAKDDEEVKVESLKYVPHLLFMNFFCLVFQTRVIPQYFLNL